MADAHPGIQARIEQDPLGRALLSVLIVVVLVVVIVSNLIGIDVLRGQNASRANRVIRVVNLHQSWPMFAPPPQTSPSLLVDVRHEDGTTSRWQRPGMRWGQYRAYRWGKLEEAMIVRRHVPVLAGFSRWIARTARADGVEGVELRERWRLLNPPGPGPSIAHEHVHEIEPYAPGPRPAKAGESV